MKILFVTTQSEIGGAQRYLLEFAPYLASKGNGVLVSAGEGDEELFKKIEDLRLKIKDGERLTYKKIGALRRNLNPIKDLLALISILKIIRNEKPDTLFLQSTKAGFLGALACRLALIFNHKSPIHVIYRIGGWSFNDPRSQWMNKILFWMEKISAPWKDVIIVNSESDKKIAIEKNIAPENKIVKIYNGIDADRMEFLSKNEARSKIPIPKSSLPGRSPEGKQSPTKSQAPTTKNIVIGTIANLYATKGIEYLIEATNILINLQLTTYNLQLIVIGEGRERPKLEHLIKQYKLENNFFLAGRISSAYKYLKALDIFVLPSVKEGFPWAVLEAMTAEIPIVATNVGAVPEIIENEKEGLLVEPKNRDSLANAIKKLAENSQLAEKLAKNAKEKVKKFSREEMLCESEKNVKYLAYFYEAFYK